MFIGRWLGPAIDVSTDMTYNILKPDGDYVCRSTVRAWTPKEEANPVRMAERVYFMEQLNSCIGQTSKLSDFPLNDLTPEFEYYADGIEDGFSGTLKRSRRHFLQHQRLLTTMLARDFSSRVVRAWHKVEC